MSSTDDESISSESECDECPAIDPIEILRDELAERNKDNGRMFMAYIWMTLWIYMWITIILFNKLN